MQNIPAHALSQGPSPPKHLSALLALAARAAHQSYLRALGVGAWSKLSPQLLEAFLLLLPTYLKKKLSEILFLQPKRSQLHTIACSEVWRGTRKPCILTTRIITFGLLLKQRKSPRGLLEEDCYGELSQRAAFKYLPISPFRSPCTFQAL